MNDTELDDVEIATSEGDVLLQPTPGTKLKQLREELGYQLTDVADALYMTERYVSALEHDEYHILPGPTFIKGYYKAYAKLLRADVDEVLACYTNHTAAMVESQESEAKVIRARKTYDQNKRWLICAAAIIAVVLIGSWWYSQ